ncbi:MAG: LysR family transcriptional regulator, partial [Deltaproteobacteria bacterium]|nr:LysR family transcriptional regulator [Deltaproteobacteria bacterium]
MLLKMEQFLRKFLADMPCFVEVADAASFTRAAERLGIPLATLSRRITALEQHLGTRLFFRGARSLTLTEDGRELLESARLMLAEAEGARQRLMLRHGEPFGPIRVSMEAAVFHCFLHGALG